VEITAPLAAFCCSLSVDRIPEAVMARTRLLLVDLIGNVIRARAEAAVTPSLLAMVKTMGWHTGESRIFGDSACYGPAGAAFLNASLGHALDFDDTHAAATLHPGACVIPAAIAAGEMAGASGADVLAGIVAGYEVTCRTALALPAGAHYARGFHPTATCGVFGAAAAAARVLRLSAAQFESALGIALSQSGGSLQFLTDGAWTKPFQVGWASMAGLSAAILAGHGFRGASEALEGRHGFLQAYAPAPVPERVVLGLGEIYELMSTGVKPYPSCRYGHAGIDATIALRAEHAFKWDEVQKITYGLSTAGMLLVGAPAETKQNPTNIVSAQFSAPFVLSTALATGAMTWDSYQNLNDPVIRNLLPRVECVHDPEIEAEFPANMSGKITIRARGREFVKTVIVPLGEPSNFLSKDALLAKYESLAKPSLGPHAQVLASAALEFDALDRITHLTQLSMCRT
jgi:2-methylcitrate dehydratase PrpD